MARLLLFSCGKALPLLLLAPSSACIIPVVPEFEDPPATQNLPPQIVMSDPGELETVTGESAEFTITVTDPNPGDDLHVRWLSDYPPNTGDSGETRTVENLMVSHRLDGQPISERLAQVSIDCSDALSTKIRVHKIMVIVADKAFVKNTFAAVLLGGQVDTRSWLYERDCQLP